MRPDVVAGRFALCDPLARGASGTVWRAWDLRRAEWCAAKLMRQRDAGDLLRFAREQGVRLTHPHLLTPYSWAAEDAHVLIASPLATGGSAHTLFGDYGPLAAPLVADLLGQLLDGLQHVHEAGLVHRDVTPANLLLEATDGGQPWLRLADFGLAVRTGDPRLTRVGTVLGTPGYLPPEVLAGAAPAPAADLYAAGRVAVALLAGRESEAPGTAPELAGVSSGPLRDVVAALIQEDPRDRPGSAAEARRALGRVPPADRPLTAAGELVVILVQLPELPPGWTAAGPAAPAGPARPVGPARPTVGSDPVRPAAPRADPVRPGAVDAGPAGRPDRGAPETVPVLAGPPPAARDRATGPTRRSRPAAAAVRWRPRLLVAAGALLTAVAVSAGVALLTDGSGGGPGTQTGTPTGSPVVSGPAAAGGPCGWQQEGNTTLGPDRRALTCVRTPSGYRWQLS